MKEYQRAMEIAKSTKSPKFDEVGLNMAIANALYAIGGSCREIAAGIVMDVVKQDDMHVEALFLYAKVGFAVNLPAVSIRCMAAQLLNKTEIAYKVLLMSP